MNAWEPIYNINWPNLTPDVLKRQICKSIGQEFNNHWQAAACYGEDWFAILEIRATPKMKPLLTKFLLTYFTLLTVNKKPFLTHHYFLVNQKYNK